MIARDDADVDELVLAVRLDNKRNAFRDRRGDVVGAEVPDIVVDLVVGHTRFAGEALVGVGVDPDHVIGRPPEDCERLAADTIPVQIRTASDPVFAYCAKRCLVEDAEAI